MRDQNRTSEVERDPLARNGESRGRLYWPGDAAPGKYFRQIRLVRKWFWVSAAALLRQKRYGGHFFAAGEKMVGVRGVEPRTLRLSSACSNQLSYTPDRSSERVSVEASERKNLHAFTLCAGTRPRSLVELRRLELLTYSLQSYRSTN